MFLLDPIKYALFLSVLLITIPSGISINCYDCTSYETSECGLEFDKTLIKKSNCADGVPCQKIIHPSIGSMIEPITRGCYKEELCDELRACLTCNKDLCNSSINATASFMGPIIFTIWVIVDSYL